MNFVISDELASVGETARRFATERVAPGYARREQDACLDAELTREMGRLGLIAPELPEDLGGVGLAGVASGIVMEAIAAADLNVAYAQLLGSLCGKIIAGNADTDLAREWVGRICRGESLVALGLTEPHAGSDASQARVRAEADGNHYVISGEKTSISACTQADAIVLFARTGAPGSGAGGMTALLVPLDDPNVRKTVFHDVGSGAVGRGSLFFDGVRVPADYRLGPEGQGFREVMQGFDYSRALIGLQVVGPARASLDETWAYTAERQAFGQPLARHQGVSFELADAEARLEAARLLCYKTLSLRDAGLPHTQEAAMAKYLAPKTAFEVIHQCLLTHGHAGYSDDYPHQQRLRDVMGLEIGDGTAQIMKLIIARQKLPRGVAP
jgi:cyclohexanecarboxyl-CoA dehydrogenase